MTKPVTAVAAHILIEEGRLGLDDPVAIYIPSAALLQVAVDSKRTPGNNFKTEPLQTPLTVRHLLQLR